MEPAGDYFIMAHRKTDDGLAWLWWAKGGVTEMLDSASRYSKEDVARMVDFPGSELVAVPVSEAEAVSKRVVPAESGVALRSKFKRTPSSTLAKRRK